MGCREDFGERRKIQRDKDPNSTRVKYVKSESRIALKPKSYIKLYILINCQPQKRPRSFMICIRE